MNLTDFLAIYASALSTTALGWNVIQSRTKLKVDILPATELLNGEPQSGALIFIRNNSGLDVHLAGVSILFPYRHPTIYERMSHLWQFRRIPRRLGWIHSNLSNYFVDAACPMRLEPRQAHKIFIPDSTLACICVNATRPFIMACVQDQLWNDVYSQSFEVRST